LVSLGDDDAKRIGTLPQSPPNVADGRRTDRSVVRADGTLSHARQAAGKRWAAGSVQRVVGAYSFEISDLRSEISGLPFPLRKQRPARAPIT